MKKALVLLNMGGPNSLEEVEVFLTNMFNDKNIITVKSDLLRKFIAFMITTSRKNEAKNNYKLLGGKSPIVGYTKELVKKLQEKLKDDTYVTFAMRYTPPFSQEIIKELKEKNIQEVFLLPLYPQYSTTTTKSSLEEFYQEAKKVDFSPKFFDIDRFYENTLYNQAIIENIQNSLLNKNANEYTLIFSAHSLPQKIVDRGDSYQKEIKENVSILTEILKQKNINFKEIKLAYQSKLGPVKWLEPSLESVLKEVINKKVLIYPLSFIVDNSESEFELSIEYKELADELEFEDYIVSKCLNDSETFQNSIVDIVKKMVLSKNIIVTGGGTGGHLAIAKGVKEELNQRGVKPIYIGSLYGQDREWFKDDNGFSEKYFFDTSGVINKGFLGKIASLVNIFKYSFKCYYIFKKHNIDLVFSVGGYSAAPASFASIFFKKPLFIHEQNSKMGSLNQFLSKKAKMLFSSYDKNSLVKDYVIEKKFFQKARVRREIKTIIFLGGSQGARAINSFAIQIAKELQEKNINIIHQTGKNDFEKIKEFYISNNIKADVFAFSNNLEEKMAKADFAISRAGASTLWQLCANNLPALFIPYPYANKDHQYYNAKFLEEQNLALIARESELSPLILNTILKLDIKSISQNLKSIISQNGAKEIVDLLLQ